MPMTVAHPLANHVGKKIPLALVEPSAALTAIMPEGRTANPAVLMARKRTISLVAVPLRLFNLLSSVIALMPNGVAALASPIIFAAILRIIALIAGLAVGIEGKSSFIAGLTMRLHFWCQEAF